MVRVLLGCESRCRGYLTYLLTPNGKKLGTGNETLIVGILARRAGFGPLPKPEVFLFFLTDFAFVGVIDVSMFNPASVHREYPLLTFVLI